jgi:hypothetical protein
MLPSSNLGCNSGDYSVAEFANLGCFEDERRHRAAITSADVLKADIGHLTLRANSDTTNPFGRCTAQSCIVPRADIGDDGAVSFSIGSMMLNID